MSFPLIREGVNIYPVWKIPSMVVVGVLRCYYYYKVRIDNLFGQKDWVIGKTCLMLAVDGNMLDVCHS